MREHTQNKGPDSIAHAAPTPKNNLCPRKKKRLATREAPFDVLYKLISPS